MTGPPPHVPGLVVTGEPRRVSQGWDYVATCGDRGCWLRVAAEREGADREPSFRAFRTSHVALARAHHSALPYVLEMGNVGERPYAVLESPEGETLAERLRWGPLPEGQIVRLVASVLEGLLEVHRRGLVHGHVTPSAIVFTGGERDAVLAGFGAEPAGREGQAGRELQGAPEPRDDLAAFGRVLYECATGRAAFARPAEGHEAAERDGLPELSGGNEPLTSPELSALIARLVRCESGEAPDTASLWQDVERLRASTAPHAAHVPIFQAAAPPRDEVPAVGHARHLRVLREAWNDVRSGTSAIVDVRGAPGSGKTRLVRRFLDEVSAEARLVLSVRCAPQDTRPFAVLGELLSEPERGEHPSASNGRHREEALRDAAQEMAPLLKRLSPELAQLFGGAAELGAPHEVQALFAEGVAEFLTRLLQSAGSAVVVIDDLHWIDAGSRTVLTRVADRARGSQTLFVVTSRTDEQSAAAVELFFRPIRTSARVGCTLGPLEPDECRQLVEGYLGTPDVPVEVLGPLLTLGDGTPMSILEVLHALVAEGLLVPFWGSWRLHRDRLEGMQFPTHTREILARRVSELSENTRRVMVAAALVGATFGEAFLARIAEGGDAAGALREAVDARVVVRAGFGEWRFVHETVREALIGQVDATEARSIQQRIGEALDAGGANDVQSVCRRAAAYAEGDWERAPERVYQTNYEAGLRTFSSFDNERALAFLTVAERAAEQARIEPDAEFYQTLGEVYVRRGALTKGRQYFQLALLRARGPLLTGILHSRVAWVDYTMGDTEGAWKALETAFSSLSHEMPRGKPLEIARAIASWRTVGRALGRVPQPKLLAESERQRLEALCAFHYQAERLAIETENPERFLAHVLQGIEQAEPLGPSRALVRSLLLYALAQVIVGLRNAGFARLRQAEAMAESIGDPVVSAYCLQIRCILMGWAGEIQAAIDDGAQLLLQRGHWIELSEYCLLCWNQNLMLGLRGQAEEAWQWVARGIEKIRHDPYTLEIGSFLEHVARAALSALGREDQFAQLSPRHRVPAGLRPEHDLYHRFALGSRVRAFTEIANLGSEFESLVVEVRSTVKDAARAHLAVSEFYVHVAHARVHQLLRGDGRDRNLLIEELSQSVRELRAIARVGVLTAHLWAIEGYLALFEHSPRRAAFLFAQADDLAQRENCPWVLYSVARGRAHLHKAEGRNEPALAQATLAATLAETLGYAYRLRWICEEFPALATRTTAQGETTDNQESAAGRQLEALIHIGRTVPANLNLADQAKGILDELLVSLRADRGMLFLSPETGGSPAFVAGRDSAGNDRPQISVLAGSSVHRAFQTGQTVREALAGEAGGSGGVGSAVASPLVLRDRIIGVVLIETRARDLSQEDGRILEALGTQAAVAIQLTRALRAHAEELRERKLLEDSLRQVQKMEAIGRLSGTIAHDFNNLLAIITATVDCAQRDHGDLIGRELADIREACERGASLTGQLLTFSRRQATAPKVVALHAMLSSAIPLVRRLLPQNIELVTKFDGERDTILADPSRFEQILLNLAANARDAMPGGGRLTISTRDVVAQIAERPNQDVQTDCLLLSVADTGQGMGPDVLRQAFEPFFTTKSQGKGTGLGLATVYGIVQQMRGRITVDSTPGEGTTFCMYFPRASPAAESVRPPEILERVARTEGALMHSLVAQRPTVVLLVDDERLILTALERGLTREGYRVIAALTGEDAIEIIKKEAPRVDVVVTDVLMPGISGPELVEQLAKLEIRAPHLFISGFTDGEVVPERLLAGGGLLVKPFTIRLLADRIRSVIEATAGLQHEPSEAEANEAAEHAR